MLNIVHIVGNLSLVFLEEHPWDRVSCNAYVKKAYSCITLLDLVACLHAFSAQRKFE